MSRTPVFVRLPDRGAAIFEVVERDAGPNPALLAIEAIYQLCGRCYGTGGESPAGTALNVHTCQACMGRGKDEVPFKDWAKYGFSLVRPAGTPLPGLVVGITEEETRVMNREA